MPAGKTRLFKIASEINIGKETIVSFLQSRGYKIENKPTAALTEEMLDEVYEKFKREKRAAEQQREKIQKHKKVVKKSFEDQAEKRTADEKAVKEVSKPEVEKPPKVETEPQKEVEVEEEPEKGPKVGEVINLEEKLKTKAEPVKEVKEKPEVEVEGEPKKIEEKLVKEAEESPEQEVAEESDVVESTEEVEVENKTEKVVEEEVEGEKSKPAAKKRKKSKKILEVQPDDDRKLKGLTIVGKIQIEKEAEKRKRRRKGKAKEDTTPEKTPKAETEDKQTPKKTIQKVVTQEQQSVKKQDEKKRRKRKKSIRDQISQKDVDRAIKETLAGMGDSHASSRSKFKQKKKTQREEKESQKQEQKDIESKTLQLTEFVTTSDLANLMNMNPNEIILKCMELGLMVTINQRLDKDTIDLIADDYGYNVEFIDQKALQFVEEEEDSEENLKPRPPIVTIMGHVDHGKTSLIDFIRNTTIVAGEAGGITQHIGAYQVTLDDEKQITFLDTPGHEAFTAMRARGAQVTDIVILVVAADDSVMPQTTEAISHARAAGVPIVVAINKMDKPDANPDRIKQQLADKNILVEDWGGSVQCAEISAKKGTNIDQLLEKVLLEAELLELKANPNRKAFGIVIEANMDKGFGPLCTVVVQKGMLRVGDTFVTGIYAGKVRAMFDERGNKMEEAHPSDPVRVVGLEGLPMAGDSFMSVSNEQEARNISTERQQLKREQELRQVHHLTLDEISAQIQIGGIKDLFLIIKGDVSGSVEALSDSLEKLSREEVRVAIIHKGIGPITENDVMLAIASKAVIIGFNVNPTVAARKIAENEKIDIRLYNIIYDCINEIQLALEGLLTPDLVEEKKSSIEVRRVFKISRLGNIAGCYVLEGKASRNDKIRVLRDGLPIHEGTIQTLKRNKDDVKEVDQGYECGVLIDGFNDIREGDILETYIIKEVKRTFS